jgi:superfamily II DNA or RNA helicase
MGLGKTRVACEFIDFPINSFSNTNYSFKILIIIKPNIFIDPWKNHIDNYFKNHLKNIKTVFFYGKDRNNYKIFHENYPCGKYKFNNDIIIVTTYETLRVDIKQDSYKYLKFFDLIIYDELHSIINSKRLTKRLKALSKLEANYKQIISWH